VGPSPPAPTPPRAPWPRSAGVCAKPLRRWPRHVKVVLGGDATCCRHLSPSAPKGRDARAVQEELVEAPVSGEVPMGVEEGMHALGPKL
jgi:hypothetical protein